MDFPHHARLRRFAFAAISFALFLPCVPAAAGTRPPKDLTLAIRFKEGKARFRQGEIIRLVLEFSSPTRNVYGGSTASHDRSGRIHLETFEVTPKEGTADPLYDYYHSGVGGYFGGGLSSTFTLGEKPFTLDRDVNEWVRFDRPGRYTLRVISPRVSRRGAPPEARWESITLTSNALELEIVPATPAWAAVELRRVDAALDGKDQAAREQAQRALRFLGTEAAAVEMARRIARGESYYLGVVGPPHRATAVRELERLLEAPDTPIAATLLGNLSVFALYEQLSEPLPRWQEGDAEATKVFHAEVERRRALDAEINAAYTKRLAPALATKTPAARVLGRYGSPDAARHLWERLEALDATWRGKPAISNDSTRPDERAALAVEGPLVEALTNSPRWALGPKEYERLATLTVSEGRRASTRQQAERLAAGVPVGFAIDGSEPGSVSVGTQHYRSVTAARERFLQYPRGTVFLWSAGPSKTAGAAFEELKTWLDQNGMRLERSPERP